MDVDVDVYVDVAVDVAVDVVWPTFAVFHGDGELTVALPAEGSVSAAGCCTWHVGYSGTVRKGRRSCELTSAISSS